MSIRSTGPRTNSNILLDGRLTSFQSTVDVRLSPNPVTIVSLYDNIQPLAAYMNGFLNEYKNPSFYEYFLDGSDIFINDGGGDMYDVGNYTTPWLIAGTNYTSGLTGAANYPNAISYANTTATLVDTNFRYASVSGYTQNGTTRPLMALGTRTGTGNPIGWQKGGNSGADGGGLLLSGLVYNGTLSNGFTTYAWVRETYSAGDPSHCDLYILLGHPNWDSTFGTINTYADPVIAGGNGGYLYTSGPGVKNVLAITLLLSKNSGSQVTLSECITVTDSITNRVRLYFGF